MAVEHSEGRTGGFASWPKSARWSRSAVVGDFPIGLVIGLTLATVVVLRLKRPDQFLHPYVFAEDGVNIAAFAERGWWSALEQLQGYFVLATKLVTLGALQISAVRFPEIAVGLTVVATAVVVVAIAVSPTHLRWRPACALVPLLIPTDPEVMGVSLYVFWWAGLLILLALLWDSRRGKTGWRYGFLVLGSLSSPLIVPFSALFLLRALWWRGRDDLVCAVIACASAVLQAASIVTNVPMNSEVGLHSIPMLIGKFVGFFAWSLEVGDHEAVWIGLPVLALIAAALAAARRQIGFPLILLALMFGLTVAVTLSRVPVEAMHPYLAGPRYFFYPYIVLGWGLLWLAAASPPSLRAGLIALVLLSVAQGLPRLARHHEPLDWKGEMIACARSDGRTIPVLTTGRLDDLWTLTLTGAQCRALIEGSLIRGTRQPLTL
jgi:hypothetical protein